MVSDAVFTEARQLLARCARAAALHGEHVVIGGRMALIAYRSHPSFLRTERPTLGTREVDAVVPRKLPILGKPLAVALADEGLVPHDALGLGLGTRGKRVFQDKRHGTAKRANEFIEFVAPRVRDDEPMVEPQPDIIASPLRFMELLLFEPIRVEMDAVAIYVPNAAMFVAQKALMRTSNTGRRVPKDLVSIFDACQLSAPRWKIEREIVMRAATSSAIWTKWFVKVPRALGDLFGEATSAGSVTVATDLRGQKEAPSATAVSRVVMDMVSEVYTRGRAP